MSILNNLCLLDRVLNLKMSYPGGYNYMASVCKRVLYPCIRCVEIKQL